MGVNRKIKHPAPPEISEARGRAGEGVKEMSIDEELLKVQVVRNEEDEFLLEKEVRGEKVVFKLREFRVIENDTYGNQKWLTVEANEEKIAVQWEIHWKYEVPGFKLEKWDLKKLGVPSEEGLFVSVPDDIGERISKIYDELEAKLNEILSKKERMIKEYIPDEVYVCWNESAWCYSVRPADEVLKNYSGITPHAVELIRDYLIDVIKHEDREWVGKTFKTRDLLPLAEKHAEEKQKKIKEERRAEEERREQALKKAKETGKPQVLHQRYIPCTCGAQDGFDEDIEYIMITPDGKEIIEIEHMY